MPNVRDSSIALDGKITFELDDGTTKVVDLANLGSGGGGLTAPVAKTSLATDVQVSLTKADSAIQPVSSANTRTIVVPSGVAYLNTSASARTVTITGGTVSAVSLATAAAPTTYVVQGATSGAFTVPAGGQIKIDWSAQPAVVIS